MVNSVKSIAVFTAKPGKAEALQSLLSSMVAPSRAEEGNLNYDLYQDQGSADRLVLDESYVSHAAVDSHRMTLHYRNYLAKVNELADRTVMILIRISPAS